MGLVGCCGPCGARWTCTAWCEGLSTDSRRRITITRVKPSELASNWRTMPPPEDLAEIGTRWIQARNTLVLAVPSAIIPRELNYLLNPLHPQFKRVRVGPPEPFFFDPRLWKR